MTTSLTSPALPEDQRVVLEDVSWELYEHLLSELGGQRVFVTYNDGRLEIMSPSWKHERIAELLAVFVRLLASELRIPLISGGSTTFRKRDIAGGLEPDHCFYIQNVGAVRGKDEIDLDVDPPPDLAIEVEVSRRMVDRLEIYRRLRVPEVWSYNLLRLKILRLGPDGYEPSDHSAAFPTLPPEHVASLIEQGRKLDELEWESAVRVWVREHASTA